MYTCNSSLSQVKSPSLVTLETTSKLALCDVSFLCKIGLKGTGSATWLEGKLPVPESTYSCTIDPQGTLIIREGKTEFFIEDGFNSKAVQAIQQDLKETVSGVYRVERQDTGLILAGEDANKVFSQTCSIDLRYPLHPVNGSDHIFYMTRIAGISCSVLQIKTSILPHYRIWCSPSLSVYLWQTLGGIVEELGGQCTRFIDIKEYLGY